MLDQVQRLYTVRGREEYMINLSSSLRLAHCKSARLRTLTAQQFGVADAPLQRTEAWRLALPLKVGMAMVREALARAKAMMVVVKCMVDILKIVSRVESLIGGFFVLRLEDEWVEMTVLEM